MSKTTGRIVGPLGVLFVLFALFSRVLLSHHFNLFMSIQLLLGVIGIAAWAVTAFDDARNVATGRGTRYVVMTAIATVVLVGALGAIDYVAVHKKTQWDLTKGHIFTLAPQTQELLKKLTPKDKVTVTAFYQPLVDREYAQLKDLFNRYKAIAGDNFDYHFVDVAKNPLLVKKFGITRTGPRIIFRTASGKEARSKDVSEQGLTNALAGLFKGASMKVYFLTGHGEKPMDPTMGKTAHGLKMWLDGLKSEGYDSTKLDLFAQKDVPKDAMAVVVAGPETPLAPGEVAALQRYADQGGNLVIMLDPGYQTGLSKLIAGWGVKLDQGVIIDPESQEPLWAFTQTFSSHPLAKPKQFLFGAIPFFFPEARGVAKTSPPSGTTVTELFKTGAEAWGETNQSEISGGKVTRDANDEPGPLPLAVAVEKKLKGGKEMRAVVYGDSDFATNEYIRQGGNRDLAINTLDWVGGQASKITIRPKLRDSSTLASLTRPQRLLLSFGSLNILPLLLIAFGLSIWSLRRSK